MKSRIVAGLAVVGVLVGANALPASAADGEPRSGRATEVHSACKQAVVEVGGSMTEVASVCSVVTESTSGPTIVVDAPELDDVVVDANQTGFARAVKAGTVRSKAWSQTKYGGTYKEIHKGTFYYDGARAWSKEQTYRGKKGSHSCGVAGSWGFGVNVATVACTQPRSGANVVNRETYKVQAVANGSPINWTLAMSMMLKANGTMTSRAS